MTRHLPSPLRLASVAVPVAVAVAFAAQSWQISDWWLFQEAADRGLDAYRYRTPAGAHPALTGPLTLLLASALPYLAAVVLTVGLLPVSLLRTPLTDGRRLLLGSAVAPFWGNLAHWGHLDDAAAVFLLVESRRHSGVARGLCIGAAIAFKPWAVLGLPFLGRDAWGWGMATAVQVVWLPVLPDVLHLGGTTVDAQSASLVRHLFGLYQYPPSWWRPVQLAAAAAAAALLLRCGRPSSALLGALLVKLMLDPGDFDYYLGPLALASLLLTRSRGLVLASLTVLFVVFFWPSNPDVGWLVALPCELLVLGIVLRRDGPAEETARVATVTATPLEQQPTGVAR